MREALLDAATELFASHGANAVSVRDIAKHAHVNHGLVHRHFGSKAALHKEVLDRLAYRVSATVTPNEEGDLRGLMSQVLAGTAAHDAYFRILARALLDGAEVSSIQTKFPVAQMMVRAAEQSGMDKPKEFVARRIAAGLGWLIFEPYIRAATGMNDE